MRAALREPLAAAYHRFAPFPVRRLRGDSMPDPVDLTAVGLIRSEPPERLADPAHLERTLLPALGLNDDVPDAFPAALQPRLGRGLQCWQLPIQLAPYLAQLARLPIRSYLEVGVMEGGTFITTCELLDRTHGLQRAVAVDIEFSPGVAAYARRRRGTVAFRQLSSHSAAFARLVAGLKPDLVLIDGDHAEDAVRADFRAVREHAKAIAFHDIVDTPWPGVGRVWAEAREELAGTHTFFEYTEQYPEVVERWGGPALGIGLAVHESLLA